MFKYSVIKKGPEGAVCKWWSKRWMAKFVGWGESDL